MTRTRKETHTRTTKNVSFQRHPPTLRRLPSALRALDKSARIPGRIARRDDHKRGPYEHMHPPILWGILCGTHVYADPSGDLIVEQMHPPNSGGFCVAFFCIGLLCSMFSCFWVRLLLYFFSDFGFLLMCIKLLLLLLLQNHYTNIRTQKHTPSTVHAQRQRRCAGSSYDALLALEKTHAFWRRSQMHPPTPCGTQASAD